MRLPSISAALLCALLLGCGKADMQSDKGRYQAAMARLQASDSPDTKFRALPGAAKESFNTGKVEDAKKYAEELMAILPDFKQDVDYGRAIHDSNMVLGRIALREGKMDDAKKYLLEAGQTPGGRGLSNYGPNMSLAKDLLDKGEKQAVLDYLDLCSKFWKFGRTARGTVLPSARVRSQMAPISRPSRAATPNAIRLAQLVDFGYARAWYPAPPVQFRLLDSPLSRNGRLGRNLVDLEPVTDGLCTAGAVNRQCVPAQLSHSHAVEFHMSRVRAL